MVTADNPARTDLSGMDHARCAALHDYLVYYGWIADGQWFKCLNSSIYPPHLGRLHNICFTPPRSSACFLLEWSYILCLGPVVTPQVLNISYESASDSKARPDYPKSFHDLLFL